MQQDVYSYQLPHRWKRLKEWQHSTRLDACSISDKTIAAKSDNTTNLMKCLTVHVIYLRAESCSVFNCKNNWRESHK